MVTERDVAKDHLSATIEKNTVNKPWKISAQVLDWTEEVDSQRFRDLDVILGADIIYIEDTFQDLLRTINSLSSSGRVLILLSCRIRYDRDTNFLNMLAQQFDIKEVLLDEDKKIKIFSVKRKMY